MERIGDNSIKDPFYSYLEVKEMNVKEFKEIVQNLPDNCDDYNVITDETLDVKQIEVEDEGEEIIISTF